MQSAEFAFEYRLSTLSLTVNHGIVTSKIMVGGFFAELTITEKVQLFCSVFPAIAQLVCIYKNRQLCIDGKILLI
jgi:hypothetical protein